ncbi:hypothetical protein AA0313_1870 [Acetobacter indonesiensis NRIC 0313]|uniref:Terminase n=1 Tax=Acetobacter indonesiensis TaxID=104101 RepID=A0A6N3TA57_9PROT|nr:hypothetical protein [Acetobacter indonesiensis]GAN62512.1 terminase [Acetobacter indonesiensis]GBQ58703.1 hypothetical protein AA0313_1870 [Acetobacter indonesiensis NRIC 0313]GEN04717.1 hypothetical protein AIN02nite_27420 [Acetobacter indonesiensis]
MSYPTFDDLPFNKRPDLSPYLIHLTKNTKPKDDYSAYENLVSILQTGRIWGSGKDGYIRGGMKAACFMDVPFASLKYVLTPENTKPSEPQYEPYGIVIGKASGYKRGLRPVLYLSDEEVQLLGIPKAEQWRVVRLEKRDDDWVNWVHEREWRCEGTYKLRATVSALHAVSHMPTGGVVCVRCR